MSDPFSAETNKEIELGQERIRCRECGTGRPVLFVHGFLVDGNLWRKPVAELAGELRCIVPDWPLGSHRVPMKTRAAQSPRGVARLVVEFMDALELDEVVLVGNDSGGAICQLVVTDHPERVSHLVLTPCDACENFPPKLFPYLKWLGSIPGGVFVVVRSLRVGALRRLPIAFGLATKRPIDDADFPHARLEVVSDSYTFIAEDLPTVLAGLVKDFLSPSRTPDRENGSESQAYG